MMIQSLESKSFRRTLAVVAGAAVLMMTWPMRVGGQTKPDEQPKPADSAKHVHPGNPDAKANDVLAEQVQQLRAKVAKLEAALSQGQETGQSSPRNPDQGTGTGAATGDKGARQSGRVSAKFQNCIQCHQTRPSGPLPPSHLETAGDTDTGTGAGGGMGKMSGGKSGGGMGMMGMGKMGGGKSGGGMGMMGGGGMGMKGMGKMSGGKSGGGMPMMDDDSDEMGMGKMSGGKSGGGMPMMDDDSDEMGMGAMGKVQGMSSMQRASALPGFPGVSHLYHMGATGFFLDHNEHITLSANQQKKLNLIKQKALTGSSSCKRKVEEGEQELWELTASDTPDAAAIEAKVHEVEKLKGNQRLLFIRAVGEAAKVLTDDQRQALAGTVTEASAQPATAKP
ncbi:Spy/CpxP family protein refolding chaperone [Singulisphaera rosea]